MKKKILNKLAFVFIFSFVFCACSSYCSENSNKINQEECTQCTIEDDEYCIYNQCYFDRQYRNLKIMLKLSENQEACIDNIYNNFKTDMEIYCARYTKEKDKLLEMIALDNECYKEQEHIVEDIKKDIKEKYNDFFQDVKEKLCKNQLKTFKCFKKEQKRKIKKILKYAKVYKFPCLNTCNN